MQFTLSHYEDPAVLIAAATFLKELAAIATQRQPEVLDYPDTLPDTTILTATEVTQRVSDAMGMVRESLTPKVLDAADPRLTAGGLSDSNMRVDMKGVAFNPDYCSEAKDPFYSSGPNQGQWKCRRGVPGATYDHWYANELAAIQLSAGGQAEQGAEVDVSAAFGPATTEAPAVVNTATPRDCGQLMVWVSEQQVAGNITPEQVQAAYAKYGLTIADLFPPNDADTISKRVALIYGELA